jgi:hypothetical protein
MNERRVAVFIAAFSLIGGTVWLTFNRGATVLLVLAVLVIGAAYAAQVQSLPVYFPPKHRGLPTIAVHRAPSHRRGLPRVQHQPQRMPGRHRVDTYRFE